MYKCYICGRTYNSPVDAANCTISCNKKEENANVQKELQEIANKIDGTYKELKNLCEHYSNLSKTETIVAILNRYDKNNLPNTIPNVEFINTSISSPRDETTKIRSCIVKDR